VPLGFFAYAEAVVVELEPVAQGGDVEVEVLGGVVVDAVWSSGVALRR
jgi:hypothetical protein